MVLVCVVVGDVVVVSVESLGVISCLLVLRDCGVLYYIFI